MVNLTAQWAWDAVGLKARLEAAATKPTAMGCDGAICRSISINRAWGGARHDHR